MTLITENLVLDHDYTRGHAKDFSVEGNDGTITNGEGFLKKGNGLAYLPDGTTSHVLVSDDASLQLTAATWVFFGDFSKELVVNQRLMAKRDAGGSNYDILTGSGNSIQIYDGTAQTVLSADPYGKQTLIITQEAGANKPKAYLDGVFVDEGSVNITLAANDADLYIANQFSLSGQNYNNALYSVLIYSDAKTPSEVAQIHKAVSNRKTAFKSKENFSTPQSIPVLASGSGWNSEIINGIIVDQGPNGNNGVVSNGVRQVESPFGSPLLRFDGSSTAAGVDFGNDSSLQISEDLVLAFFLKVDAASGTQLLITNWVAGETEETNSQYYIQTIVTGLQYIHEYGAGNDESNVWANAFRPGVLHRVVFVRDASEKTVKLYVDGEQFGSDFNYTNGPTGGSSTSTRLGGSFAGEIGDVIIAPETWSEVQIKEDWNKYANKVIYYQDFSDAYEHQAAITDGPIPGTDWSVSSVSGRIGAESDGTKYITSPSAGNVLKRPGPDHTFGRLEIDVTPTSGTRVRHLFADLGTFAILDVGDSGSARIAYTTSTGGVVFATSSVDFERQVIRVDKKANVSTNNTTLYKDGVQLTAATGSNPCTDVTDFQTERQLTTYSNAKIHSIKHYFGVPIE